MVSGDLSDDSCTQCRRLGYYTRALTSLPNVAGGCAITVPRILASDTEMIGLRERREALCYGHNIRSLGRAY